MWELYCGICLKKYIHTEREVHTDDSKQMTSNKPLHRLQVKVQKQRVTQISSSEETIPYR